MSSPQDRRRYPRYDVRRLPGVLDGFRKFETLKLSAGGALIRLPDELSLAQRVHVAVDLEGKPFRSVAHVVFVGPDTASQEPAYRIGLAFADTPPREQETLEVFIDQALAGGGS
jgi:c-di-GMP-binding flagellar brake protein YcgR